MFPRSVTERNLASYLYNNNFCLKWKSENFSFYQAIKELKDNFKLVDNYITEERVKHHFENIYTPKKIQSHLTNFITYDLETHIIDRARPYVFCYRLSKLAGKYNRDLTPYQMENVKKILLLFMMIIV